MSIKIVAQLAVAFLLPCSVVFAEAPEATEAPLEIAEPTTAPGVTAPPKPQAELPVGTVETTPGAVPAATLTGESFEKPAEKVGTLEDVLRSVIAKNAQIQEALGDVEIARAQLDRARAAAFPRGEGILIGAPIFEEKGNALNSQSNLKKWGPFAASMGRLVQPLFTFGQLGGYKSAAEHQISARQELAEAKRQQVLQTAKEFYYGYQMARELEKLVEGLVSFLEEAVTAATESSKKQSKDAVKPHDLYRLKIALEDLKQKKLLATQGTKIAARAVRWISGGGVDPKAEPLVAEAFEPATMEEYVKSAKTLRPELRAIREGKEARLSLRGAKRAQSYPTIFLAGFWDFTWSPVREKQRSVFALDQFNRLQGGGGLGLRIDLEFARHSAEAAEENAEYMKLEATERYAQPGIELEVKKAYFEVEQAREGLNYAKNRRDLAKKWFVSNAMGWSVGVTPAKDLLESLQGDGEARKNYIETVYALNIALGKLSQAVGKEVTALKYR